MTTNAVQIGLTAVIVALEGENPCVLATRDREQSGDGLPFGPFDPVNHRTFEIGLRSWVEAQTGFDLGYVEQLYTFGDRGRDLPVAEGLRPDDLGRVISVGYLGLTPEATEIGAFEAVWRSWYRFFPWEDHRKGRPQSLDESILALLTNWATKSSNEPDHGRLARINLAFGFDGHPWIEERVLERYELLYEAKCVPEYFRDRGVAEPEAGTLAPGSAMRSDHRRILATAMGRLRGKLKYRPVVFELTPDAFTLSKLQAAVEAVLGLTLHKQNFRRALDKTGLVEGLGRFETATGGRPAELFRFKRETLSERVALGVQTPRRR